MANKGMQIMCKKCESVFVIDETKRTKIKKLDCHNCGEESYLNWLIIGQHKKPLHDIDQLIRENIINDITD